MLSKLQKLPGDLKVLGWENVAPTFFCSWLANVPSVIIGDPGAAKTTFQVRFAKALGLSTDILDLQYLSVTRLLGIPNPEELKRGVLNYVGGLLSTKPELVILDELNRCQDQVQGIILEFVREGRLNNQFLKCKRVASCNPPTNNLVGVHYLDYAQATRLVHIPVPNLSTSLWGTFIDEWGTNFEIPEEVQKTCRELNDLELVTPDMDHAKSLAINMLNAINPIPFSGRQLDTLLRLMAASWTLESAGWHSFTATDLARLAVSLIPYQLTRNSFGISDPDTFILNVSKKLPDYPWQEKEVQKSSNLSVEVEQSQRKFQMMELEAVLQNCIGDLLENHIAFEVFLSKAVLDPKFNQEFDNWNLLDSLMVKS